MPKNAKMYPPATAKMARISPEATDAFHAAFLRSIPSVMETKMGAAEMGLIMEKSEEKARIAKFTSKAGIFIFLTSFKRNCGFLFWRRQHKNCPDLFNSANPG